MTTNQKAIENLAEKGISALEDNGTVYIIVNETPFELAQYEIDFQAKEYDESQSDI
jgi:hypothetical protein